MNKNARVRIHTHTHTHTHRHRHTYIYMYIYIYNIYYIYICMYVYMYVCMYVCMCTRISRNTRSSNPLLETRLIPRIAICLWRPLLRRYWLRVISCKLGCLAAGSFAPGARSHVCKPGTRTARPWVLLRPLLPFATIDTAGPWRTAAAHALRFASEFELKPATVRVRSATFPEWRQAARCARVGRLFRGWGNTENTFARNV